VIGLFILYCPYGCKFSVSLWAAGCSPTRCRSRSNRPHQAGRRTPLAAPPARFLPDPSGDRRGSPALCAPASAVFGANRPPPGRSARTDRSHPAIGPAGLPAATVGPKQPGSSRSGPDRPPQPAAIASRFRSRGHRSRTIPTVLPKKVGYLYRASRLCAVDGYDSTKATDLPRVGAGPSRGEDAQRRR
jgi:hypothetical protein